MNIKKQIRNLYFYEVFCGLQVVDVVWVFFLIQRGFSLAQVGIAEGVFHAVSMCCEIPSGMISDTIGRRKTLILSGLVSAGASLLMIVSDYFGLILCAMGLNALSYNLMSGTREALTYDSLLQEGKEGEYLKISSRQEAIYQGLNAVTSLLSVVTVALGYRIAYSLSAVQGLLCAKAAGNLTEARINGKLPGQKLSLYGIAKGMKEHFCAAFCFLRENAKVRDNMLLSGLLSSGSYLVFMFMQEHAVDCGLAPGFIGFPLLFLSGCMMVGAFLAGKTGGFSMLPLLFAAGIGTGLFIALSGNSSLLGAVAAAGMAQLFTELAVVRLGNENQKAFSSAHRATMVSVESMVYSIFMAVLSPAAGAVGRYAGLPAGFAALGVFTGLAAAGLVLKKRRDCM